MSVFERFFGRREDGAADKGKPVANPAIENPLALAVLFTDPPGMTSEGLTASLRAYHADLARATADVDSNEAGQPETSK